MKYYICYMYLGEAGDPAHWAQYIRTSEALAMDVFKKWKSMAKEDITGFGVTVVEIDPVSGLSTSSNLVHHVNPLPKKVIYNQVAGIKAKTKSKSAQYADPVIVGGFDLPPAGPDVDVNWHAVHQVFANL